MNMTFLWNDTYSVGNPEIDGQHKRMFDLANRLPELSGEADIKPVIMRLFKYTREHFSHEEEEMRSIGFPLLDEHILLHDDLISQLNKITSQPLITNDDIYVFKKFICEWLILHIMIEDNKYFQFSRAPKKGVRTTFQVRDIHS